RALLGGELPVRDLRDQLGRGAPSVPGGPQSLARQAIRFAAVGALSTLAYLVLFVILRPLGAQTANLLALFSTAMLNTAANRRFTFGVTGSGAIRHQLQGLLVF